MNRKLFKINADLGNYAKSSSFTAVEGDLNSYRLDITFSNNREVVDYLGYVVLVQYENALGEYLEQTGTLLQPDNIVLSMPNTINDHPGVVKFNVSILDLQGTEVISCDKIFRFSVKARLNSVAVADGKHELDLYVDDVLKPELDAYTLEKEAEIANALTGKVDKTIEIKSANLDIVEVTNPTLADDVTIGIKTNQAYGLVQLDGGNKIPIELMGTSAFFYVGPYDATTPLPGEVGSVYPRTENGYLYSVSVEGTQSIYNPSTGLIEPTVLPVDKVLVYSDHLSGFMFYVVDEIGSLTASEVSLSAISGLTAVNVQEGLEGLKLENVKTDADLIAVKTDISNNVNEIALINTTIRNNGNSILNNEANIVINKEAIARTDGEIVNTNIRVKDNEDNLSNANSTINSNSALLFEIMNGVTPIGNTNNLINIPGENFLHGTDASGTFEVHSLDDITKTGFYEVGKGAIGNPNIIDVWKVEHIEEILGSGTGSNQTAYNTANEVFIRSKVNGIWTAWQGIGGSGSADLVREELLNGSLVPVLSKDSESLGGILASGYARSSLNILTGAGISGGGNLTANRTFALDLNSLPETTSPATNFFIPVEAPNGTTNKATLENLLASQTRRFFITLTDGGNGGTTDDPDFPTLTSASVVPNETLYIVANSSSVSNTITGADITYNPGGSIRAKGNTFIHEQLGIKTVFGRSEEDIVQEYGDYSGSLILNDSTLQGLSLNDTLEYLDNRISNEDNSGLDTRITANTNNIATNLISITSNANLGATNRADISSLDTRVSGLINTNTSDIASNALTISTNALNISTNVNGIALNKSATENNAGEIIANREIIDTNADIVTNLTSAVTTNTGNISSNTTEIEDLKLKPVLFEKNNSSSLTTLGSNYSNVTSGIGIHPIESAALGYGLNGNSIHIGSHSGNDGNEVVALGTNSGNTNNNDSNTFIGFSAGLGSDGSESVFLGNDAGLSARGNRSTYIGKESGNSSDGSNNIYIGYKAGKNAAGSNNISIGNNLDAGNNGSDNILIGENATSGGFSNVIVVGSDSTSTLTITPTRDNQVVLGNSNTTEALVGGKKVLLEGSGVDPTPTEAKDVIFDNTGTNFTDTNVQAVLEEIGGFENDLNSEIGLLKIKDAELEGDITQAGNLIAANAAAIVNKAEVSYHQPGIVFNGIGITDEANFALIPGTDSDGILYFIFE